MEPKEFDFDFPRGNTCPVKFTLVDKAGNLLSLQSGDELYFTIKTNYTTSTEKLQKSYGNGDITKEEDGSYKFTIDAEDTENWDYRNYVWDLCIVSGDYTKTIAIGTIALTNVVKF